MPPTYCYMSCTFSFQMTENDNITVYAVGIGSNADQAQLNTITSNSARVTVLSSYTDLAASLTAILKQIFPG